VLQAGIGREWKPGEEDGVAVSSVLLADLVIGAGSLAVGATFWLRRQRLARKGAQRGRAMMGPTGWAVLGGLWMLVGLLWVAIAFA
jgi:hypothetical protein